MSAQAFPIVTLDMLQGLFVAALFDRTVALDQVFAPRNWPTLLGETPILLIRADKEDKQGAGRNGAPQFTNTAQITCLGRLTAPATAGDATAGVLRAALGVFQRQMETAVVNSFDLTRLTQQIARIEMSMEVTAEGEQYVGEVSLTFHVEYYQGPEAFFPIEGDPLTEVKVFADFINIRDPTGVYAAGGATDTLESRLTDGGDTRITGDGDTRITGDTFITPFADGVTDAPRTRGPDGRAEGTILIRLPQD